MNRRGTGTVFCLSSAIVYSTRYIAAAIFGSGISSWNKDLYQAMLEYVGPNLKIASMISLAVGLVYLIWSEIENSTNS